MESMAQRSRFQYPEAIDHLVARGIGIQDIVYHDVDRGRLQEDVGKAAIHRRGQTVDSLARDANPGPSLAFRVCTLVVLRRTTPSLREPLLIAAHVKMAEGDGASIGDVVGLGKVVQAQLGLDRVLDLQLGSPAVAGERFLDPGRGITEDRRLVLGRGQHDRAASMGHQDRGARITHMAVDSLDGDRAGRKRLQNLDDPLVNVTQPLTHPGMGRTRTDHTGLDHERPTRRWLDHCVSGDIQSRVDPQHAARDGGNPCSFTSVAIMAIAGRSFYFRNRVQLMPASSRTLGQAVERDVIQLGRSLAHPKADTRPLSVWARRASACRRADLPGSRPAR